MVKIIIKVLSIIYLAGFLGAAHASESLNIGIISNKPLKAIKRTQPLADYLAEKVFPGQNVNATVKVTSDPSQMGVWLESGKVDFTAETLFTSLYLREEFGAEIGLWHWKNGVSSYNSVFITHAENEMNSFDDLIGKILLFEDPDSSSGFYIPAATLIQEGYQLFHLDNIKSEVPEGKIGYLFINQEQLISNEVSLTAWVYRKFVAAGAYSNEDWDSAKNTPESFKKALKIFHSTEVFPRSLILFSPLLTASKKQQIKHFLLQADKDEAGKKVLKAFKKTKKFDVFGSEQLQAIEHGEALYHIVNSDLK